MAGAGGGTDPGPPDRRLPPGGRGAGPAGGVPRRRRRPRRPGGAPPPDRRVRGRHQRGRRLPRQLGRALPDHDGDAPRAQLRRPDPRAGRQPLFPHPPAARTRSHRCLRQLVRGGVGRGRLQPADRHRERIGDDLRVRPLQHGAGPLPVRRRLVRSGPVLRDPRTSSRRPRAPARGDPPRPEAGRSPAPHDPQRRPLGQRGPHAARGQCFRPTFGIRRVRPTQPRVHAVGGRGSPQQLWLCDVRDVVRRRHHRPARTTGDPRAAPGHVGGPKTCSSWPAAKGRPGGDIRRGCSPAPTHSAGVCVPT